MPSPVKPRGVAAMLNFVHKILPALNNHFNDCVKRNDTLTYTATGEVRNMPLIKCFITYLECLSGSLQSLFKVQCYVYEILNSVIASFKLLHFNNNKLTIYTAQ